tara:strand:+ start:250 stop:468 length:219 start_codon:yes stop_codon:yes gene_type:complete
MEIHQQISLGSTEIANLIETHQDLMEDNDAICEVVNLGRHSLEFFIALNDKERALYEVLNTKAKLMRFLGLE